MTQQTPATFSDKGLASYGEASEDYELAPIGIASMQEQVKRLAEFGRRGDIYVIHAAEGETVIPMEVLDANPQIKALLFNQMEEMGVDPERYIIGNELNSINPVTGMREFGFFSSIFKSAKNVVKKVVKIAKKIAPIALPLAASFFGVPFLGAAFPAFGAGTIGAAALSSGIGTLIGGGSLKDAFKSALIGGGTAGIFGALRGGAAGFKASLTGQTPIYGINPATGVKELIGHQAAATPSQVWKSITGGDPIGGAIKSFKGYSGTFDPVEGYVNPAASVIDPTKVSIGLGPQNLDILPSGATGLDPTGIPIGSVRYNPAGAPGPAESLWNKVKGGTDTAAVGSGVDASTAASQVKLPPGFRSIDEYLKYQKAGLVPVGPHLAAANTGMFGGTGPLGLPEITGSKLADTAIYGGGAYLTADALGAFTPAEPEDPRETADAARSVFDPIVIDPVLAEQSEIDVSTQIPTSTAEELLQPTLFSADGGSVQKMAVGGYPRRELLVEGPGTERSDDIPAMLSDGEFVINSKAVRGADPSGRGNRYAGAQNLYNMMRNFEMRA